MTTLSPPHRARRWALGALTGLVLWAPASLVLWSPDAAGAQAAVPQARVVLLHGLARAPRAMRPLEKRLTSEGFRVHNLGYPSLSDPPEDLVDHLRVSVDDCCADAEPVHFVGHSLGGILVRALLAEHRPPTLGRVVMLAPPNRGSELVDRFADEGWFTTVLGPTAADLGTDPESLPNRLPPPDYELGVIAAAHPMASRMGRWLLTGRNDGVVTVASTRLPGMADFRLVESGHIRIRTDEVVTEETLHFLRHGRFALGERAALAEEAAGAFIGLAADPPATEPDAPEEPPPVPREEGAAP